MLSPSLLLSHSQPQTSARALPSSVPLPGSQSALRPALCGVSQPAHSQEPGKRCFWQQGGHPNSNLLLALGEDKEKGLFPTKNPQSFDIFSPHQLCGAYTATHIFGRFFSACLR